MIQRCAIALCCITAALAVEKILFLPVLYVSWTWKCLPIIPPILRLWDSNNCLLRTGSFFLDTYGSHEITAGYAKNFRVGLLHWHFCCRCLVSKPIPILDSLPKTTGGHFFGKSQNELVCLAKNGVLAILLPELNIVREYLVLAIARIMYVKLVCVYNFKGFFRNRLLVCTVCVCVLSSILQGSSVRPSRRLGYVSPAP